MAKRRGRQTYGCVKCRYPITGLRTPICPECGSDLEKTGVRPVKALPIPLAIALRCLLLVLPPFAGVLLAEVTLPRPVLSQTLEYVQTLPDSGGRMIVAIGSSDWVWSWVGPRDPDTRSPITQVQYTHYVSGAEVDTLIVNTTPDEAGVSDNDIIFTDSNAPPEPTRATRDEIDTVATWLESQAIPMLHNPDLCLDLAGLFHWRTTAGPVDFDTAVNTESLRSSGINVIVRQRSTAWPIGTYAFIVLGALAWLILCSKFARRSAFIVPFDETLIAERGEEAG